MPTPSPKRILVIKLKQPGDVLVSTPVIGLNGLLGEMHQVTPFVYFLGE